MKHSSRKPKKVTDLGQLLGVEVDYPRSLMSYNIHEKGSAIVCVVYFTVCQIWSLSLFARSSLSARFSLSGVYTHT